MVHYKLVYFNGRGRGELARWIFEVAGQPYEDQRVEHADWTALKPKTPFGQLPVLNVDGKELCQNKTIARYLAKELGLGGKNSFDEARASMIVECVEEFELPITMAFREKQPEKHAVMKKQVESDIPNFLAKFEALLKSNNGGKKYFVGDELTWADLAVVLMFEWATVIEIVVDLDKYLLLKAHRQLILGIPRLADWLKRRPTTGF